MKLLKTILLVLFATLYTACSTSSLVMTSKALPQVYEDKNATHEQKNDIKVSLFRLNNYTDTPRAGMRASNILEGVLHVKGYNLRSHTLDKTPSLNKARKIAKAEGSKYFMYGGVSEWRYKTGIDGEPAVSLHITLYKAKNKKVVWSATGSDSDWGNASIGTTAQDLIVEMLSAE